MPRLRLFTAIQLPNKVQKAIGSTMEKASEGKSGVRWVKPDHFHVTLHFLGEQEETVLPGLFKVLESAASSTPDFRLAYGGVGGFPDLKKPRVLFVPVLEGKEDLERLASKITGNLKKSGISADENEFYGHVTIGRVKILKGVSRIVRLLQESVPARLTDMRSSGIALFQSRLTPEGSVYQVVKDFPFQMKRN